MSYIFIRLIENPKNNNIKYLLRNWNYGIYIEYMQIIVYVKTNKEKTEIKEMKYLKEDK